MTNLRAFGKNIWTIEGPAVRDMGLMFTTRMTVVRLSEGSLWVESPVALAEETLQQIKSLGVVRYLVASTQRHIWRLKGWHALFPDAELWAPLKAPLTLGGVAATAHDVFTDSPPQGWLGDFEQLPFKGSSLLKEVLFLHRASRTVILGDLIQANPMIKGRPFRNAIFKVAGAAAPKGGVGLDIRLSFRDKALARQSVGRLLSWDFDKLIIGHGTCVEKDAKHAVREAFRWLIK